MKGTLKERVDDYHRYYMLPTGEKRGQLWEEYNLDTLLHDIIHIYSTLLFIEPEIRSHADHMKEVLDG